MESEGNDPRTEPAGTEPAGPEPAGSESAVSEPAAGPARSRPPRRRSPRGTPAFTREALVWMLAPLAAFLVLTVLILTTGKPGAPELMRQATQSFGDIQRGVFTFELTITPRGGTSDPATVALTGPFELVKGKQLPVSRINYTISSGGRSQVVTLLTTGDKAYTELQGQAYELPPQAVKNLREATKDLNEPGEGPGLSGLDLNFEKWLIDPKVAAGKEIDGTPTWRTRARVDVVEAIRDLTSSANAFGGITGQNVPELKESDLDDLRRDVKNAQVDVFVGRYDRLVRRLDMSMDFVTPKNLTDEAGGVTGGRLNIVLAVSRPNEPVNVKAPSDPLPSEALESLQRTGQSGTALDDGVGR